MKNLKNWHTPVSAALALVLAFASQFSPAEPADVPPAAQTASAPSAGAAELSEKTVLDAAPRNAAALFENPRPWLVDLRFTPDAWARMEPRGGGNMFSLMAKLAGGDGGRGPADLLAAAMVKRGDRNRDGVLNRDEFDSLAGRWFTQWDNTRAGTLDVETLRAGLKATLDPEGVFESKFPVFLRGSGGRRNGLAPAIGIDFEYASATLDFEGTRFGDVGVRFKGNGTFIESRATLKRSLKVDLDHFVKGQKLAGITKLNLHNNVTDASSLIEPVAYGLYRAAGVPAPRTGYAEVYLTVPPKYDQAYLGLYSIVENVDKDFAGDRFGSRGGAIFKPVTPNLFADLGDTWPDFEQAYDPKTEVSEAQARRVIAFATLMSHATDSDVAARVGEFLDLDKFARFMAVTAYLASLDSILQVGQNYYLYLDPGTNRFQFIPWDLDHSFGRIFGDQDELAKLSIHAPWVGPNRFLERVFNVPAFKALYLARLREFSETIFSPERVAARADEIAVAIRPSVEGESTEKLVLFDQAAAEGAPAEGAAAAPRRRSLKLVKAFSRVRTQSVRDQLSGKSQGVRPKPAGPGAGRRDDPPGASKPQGQGRTLASVMFAGFDADHDGRLSRAEFTEGFGRWFSDWCRGHDQGLTEEQLRDAIRAGVLPPVAKPTPGPPD
jgi:spore coat protein CotH